MKILFEEQDLINAIAVFAAIEYNHGEFEGCNPGAVTVKLEYDEHKGIHAHVTKPFRQVIHLSDQDIMVAMATYLEIYHTFNPAVLVHEVTYFHDENKYEGVSSVI